jgi:hypothetical protein
MDSEHTSSFLNSVKMEELFLETFGPLLIQRGFQYVGKIRWIRDLGIGFKHVFYLHPLRAGADYYPHGALSFDFVPRIEAGRVRLRPGSKHTRFHLSVAGSSIGSDRAIDRNGQSAPRKCREIAERVVISVTNVLGTYQTLGDALAKFHRDKLRKPYEFYCYPESALAYAFTLSAVGRIQVAKAELGKVLKNPYFDPETHSAIRALLTESTPSNSPHS